MSFAETVQQSETYKIQHLFSMYNCTIIPEAPVEKRYKGVGLTFVKSNIKMNTKKMASPELQFKR